MRVDLHPAARTSPTACPPPPTGPPPPPAPVPPGPPRDFRGVRFGHSTGVWWRAGDQFALRLGVRVASIDGYGRWADAVAAAATASAGRAGAVAICDDRGRLYLYTVVIGSGFVDATRPLHMGARRETGYAFIGDAVRGMVDGTRTASRGDCLHPWIPVPPLPRG